MQSIMMYPYWAFGLPDPSDPSGNTKLTTIVPTDPSVPLNSFGHQNQITDGDVDTINLLYGKTYQMGNAYLECFSAPFNVAHLNIDSLAPVTNQPCDPADLNQQWLMSPRGYIIGTSGLCLSLSDATGDTTPALRYCRDEPRFKWSFVSGKGRFVSQKDSSCLATSEREGGLANTESCSDDLPWTQHWGVGTLN